MIYAVVQVTVTDPQTFAAYAEQAGPGLAKWGAKAEAVSATPTCLDGDVQLPGRVVLLSFPDREAATGWINDPELAHIHGLRRNATRGGITLIG